MTNTKRSPDGAKQLALAILDVMDTGAKGKQRIGVTEMGELFWQALQLPENVQKMTIEEIARARGIDPPVFDNGVGRKHWLQVLYADQPELLVVKPGAKDSPAGRRFTDALIRWERKRVLSPREQRGRRND